MEPDSSSFIDQSPPNLVQHVRPPIQKGLSIPAARQQHLNNMSLFLGMFPSRGQRRRRRGYTQAPEARQG